MFKIPPNLTGLTVYQEQVLLETLRCQDLIEQALGYGGASAMQAYFDEQERLQKLAHPELGLIEQHQKLVSGATAHAKEMEEAMRPALDLSKQLEISGRGVLQCVAQADEQLALVLGQQTLKDAYDASAIGEFDRASSTYSTYSSLAESRLGIEAVLADAVKGITGTLLVEATISAAMKIDQPWIDSLYPGRSFEAFGALSEVGRAIGNLKYGDLAASASLTTLLGTWTPPSTFADLTEAQRFATYMDVGIDKRLFDIPKSAFEAAAFAAGIVRPAPEIRPPRSKRAKAKTNVQKVSITYSVSIGQDAQAQVIAVELMLRYELGWRASTKHGAGWMKKFIHGAVLAEVKERQANARVGKSASLLDFLTFGELVQIIMRTDMWESAFAKVTMTREEFRVAVDRLIELRNAVGHVRSLDPVEFVWAFAEATRLQRAFGLPNFDAWDEKGS